MRIKIDIKLPHIRVDRVIRSFIAVDLLLWGGSSSVPLIRDHTSAGTPH